MRRRPGSTNCCPVRFGLRSGNTHHCIARPACRCDAPNFHHSDDGGMRWRSTQQEAADATKAFRHNRDGGGGCNASAHLGRLPDHSSKLAQSSSNSFVGVSGSNCEARCSTIQPQEPILASNRPEQALHGERCVRPGRCHTRR
jgi:hypothetical protein